MARRQRFKSPHVWVVLAHSEYALFVQFLELTLFRIVNGLAEQRVKVKVVLRQESHSVRLKIYKLTLDRLRRETIAKLT